VIEGSNFLVATLADSNSLQSFLEAAPGRLRLCRELEFMYRDNWRWGPEKDADLELIIQCPNLRKIHPSFSLDATTEQHFVLNSESFGDDDAYVAVTSLDSSLVDIYPLPTSAFAFLSMIAPLWLSSLSSAALRVFDALFRKSKNIVSSNENLW
jgi:hypothetical protein